MVTQIHQLPPVQQQDDELSAHHRDFQKTHLTTTALPVSSDILLGTVRDGRLRVRSPIRVELTSEGEHIIAEAVEFNEFGFGKNRSEALSDLQRAVVELYFKLQKEQGRLGPDLQLVWATLQHKIELQKR